MKNKILLILIPVLLLTTIVSAHPGRTDANGGHWNRSTGEYHFHSGKYAGQPSSSSSSESEYVPFEPPYDPPTDNPYKKDNAVVEKEEISNVVQDSNNKPASKDKNDKWGIGEIVAGAFVLLWIVSLCIVILQFIWENIILEIYENFIYKLSPSYIIKKYEESVATLAKAYIDLQECYRKIEKQKNEIVIPDNFEIGTDGLPREKSFEIWGKQFTVYTTAYGKCIHKRYNCSGATNKHHICNLEKNPRYSYCLKCYDEYPTPNLNWFYAYKDYKKRLAEHSRRNKNFIELYEEVKKQKYNCNRMRFIIIFSKKLKHRLNNANKSFSYFEIVYRKANPILFERFKNRYNNA